MADHNDFGKLAEDLATEFLIKKKYRILVKNYRFQKAEIDIIAENEETIVIVEVKARSYNTIMEPQEAVTKSKIKLLVKAADAYLNENPTPKEVRFDIITVMPDQQGVLQLTHLEDAFQSFDAN
ncbi:endonuclease [Chryseobacterium sp. 6424]|uniref:YraN family protein n=1 Tax=Chryseobacterium sp. 6424 TaxID=2039166 RepID=UPI000EFCA544|nr:YraN family protein [Chryseobacterium sp. 6424]AYO58750.1 endonuclease [Chryseobacterium sp. 6424]